MINNPYANSDAQQPRSLIRVNDQQLLPISWEVNNNGYYQADTFEIELSIDDLPASHDLNWFCLQTALKVEIFSGWPSDPNNPVAYELEQHMLGLVDDMEPDLVNRTLRLSGRDLSGQLIDTRTTDKYPNLTASQVATKLAATVGLTPEVTKTTTKVGTYYQIDTSLSSKSTPQWDLLTFLAQREGFLCYVRGTKLYFGPPPADSDNPYVLQWTPPGFGTSGPQLNASTLQLRRNLTLAKDLIVEVRSWNPKTKTAVLKKATATHTVKTYLSGLPQPVGNAQVYGYNIPGLTPKEAQDRANALLKELSKHELVLSATLPGDESMDITVPLELRGTGTFFDQRYYVDSVQRHMDVSGYTMSVTAKNHPVESRVILE